MVINKPDKTMSWNLYRFFQSVKINLSKSQEDLKTENHLPNPLDKHRAPVLRLVPRGFY